MGRSDALAVLLAIWATVAILIGINGLAIGRTMMDPRTRRWAYSRTRVFS